MRHDVSWRIKDFASLVRKALEKQRDRPFEQIRDIAGVRAIVPFAELAERAGEVVERTFEVVGREVTADRYRFDQLGYRGLHYEVRLRPEDTRGDAGELAGAVAEIQIHTRAEAAWAEAGHDLTYKPRAEPPPATKRRIFRLVALVELFDDQMQAARDELLAVPGFKEGVMLGTLERHFLPLARQDFDRPLSLAILRHLQGAYTAEELAAFDGLMDEFVLDRRELLRGLFQRYERDRRHFLLFQPEALAVFERLDADALALVDAWDANLPPELVDSLAAVWGRSLAPFRGQ